ncbi:hypothetical protein BDZ45DRAFT_672670 [Acephala macrosclerotiorum]|nr:hypothetical protein BDZ45DRAFT_672670 [Acephala macrosclerotiorum]
MAQAVRAVARTGAFAASAPAKTSEWLVILADKPGVLERRLQIRPTHSKNFVELHKSGFVSWAGPVFKDHVEKGKTRPFIGSVMVVNAVDQEEVRSTLEKDIFVKEGIWDMARVQILPFKTIVRQPKGDA